ncbi:IclR family transcriptional regulator [Cupriavidus consociatus]|uniref:IclR family transcriptional regulator n=1 Tax=Cupriavidus consociatus TaxID=2821357 RepID=UPI001AEA7B7F|nr:MULTISPECIES: helix-turn-helix domain-containing protein [unclassified Cupriavidus]MBP0623193.1 helix-turn-helix domain-containing protein [Cupriavidus sp. LEh25]MDK2659886.1 helix-turn-helix domain-containing protein [Cupriavidus sp. LEh21]
MQAKGEQDTDGRLVSALARGIAIVRCFTPTRQELSVRELIELTGLPKPTLFRLLETLCDLGLLHYSERLSKYVGGVGLLNFAAPVLARMTVRQLARPMMEELANHICGQVQLVVGYRDTLSYADIVQGSGSKVFRPEVGMSVSISRTASGRAYLCSFAENDLADYLEKFRERHPGREEWLLERLEDARQDIAEHGFCRGHRDLHREIEVIAVPMRWRRDEESWIFSASVPVFSPQSKALVEDVGPRLVSLVRNVEASIGGVS